MKTQYERRLDNATEAVMTHSKLDLPEAELVAAAVLHAVDTMPEKLR